MSEKNLKPQSSYFKYIPWLIGLGLLLETLDSTIINTAIPDMALELHTHPLNLKIAITSYLLSLSMFIPISGYVADKYGTRKILLYSVLIFLLGSALCGFANNLLVLIIGRFIQGIGGALMMPTGRLVLVRLFHRKELVQAFSHLAILGQLGTVIGPTIGGAITTGLGWRWIFFVNIPIGLVFLRVIHKIIPELKQEKIPKFDSLGFILFSIPIALFIFAITFLTEHAANYITPLLMLAAVSVFIILFYFHARRLLNPVLNLALLKIPSFQIGIFGGTVFRCALSGVPLLLPLLFQLNFRLSALYAGLLLIPFGAGTMCAKLFVTQLYNYFGYRRLLIMNSIMVSLLLFSLSFINGHNFIFLCWILLFLLGLFASFQYTYINTSGYFDIQEQDKSNASSIASLSQMLSGAMGICIAAGLLLIFRNLQHSESFALNNFRYTFMTLALIALASLIIFCRAPKNNDG